MDIDDYPQPDIDDYNPSKDMGYVIPYPRPIEALHDGFTMEEGPQVRLCFPESMSAHIIGVLKRLTDIQTYRGYSPNLHNTQLNFFNLLTNVADGCGDISYSEIEWSPAVTLGSFDYSYGLHMYVPAYGRSAIGIWYTGGIGFTSRQIAYPYNDVGGLWQVADFVSVNSSAVITATGVNCLDEAGVADTVGQFHLSDLGMGSSTDLKSLTLATTDPGFFIIVVSGDILCEPA